jgi:hypothetical protein
MRHRSALLLLLVSCVAVLGQPAQQPRRISGLPVESVTVVGVKPSDATIKDFVETRATATPLLNKMARWTARVCPLTVGLGDKYAKYVSRRIRDIAAAVGAPVNNDPHCRPNIQVVFTTTPQGLMDNVRKGQALLLGYHHTNAQADELARVTHPIQAWYATESIDTDGTRIVDDGGCGFSATTTLNTQTDAQTPIGGMATAGTYQLTLPCAMVMHASGSRVNNGLSSGFFNVVIVAEPARLYDYEIGSLADYVAMMALSQPASLDSCQALPSISNLLAPGCASVPARITDGDLAYLRALYYMPDGEGLNVQHDYLRGQMFKTLVTEKGG